MPARTEPPYRNTANITTTEKEEQVTPVVSNAKKTDDDAPVTYDIPTTRTPHLEIPVVAPAVQLNKKSSTNKELVVPPPPIANKPTAMAKNKPSSTAMKMSTFKQAMENEDSRTKTPETSSEDISHILTDLNQLQDHTTAAAARPSPAPQVNGPPTTNSHGSVVTPYGHVRRDPERPPDPPVTKPMPEAALAAMKKYGNVDAWKDFQIEDEEEPVRGGAPSNMITNNILLPTSSPPPMAPPPPPPIRTYPPDIGSGGNTHNPASFVRSKPPHVNVGDASSPYYDTTYQKQQQPVTPVHQYNNTGVTPDKQKMNNGTPDTVPLDTPSPNPADRPVSPPITKISDYYHTADTVVVGSTTIHTGSTTMPSDATSSAAAVPKSYYDDSSPRWNQFEMDAEKLQMESREASAKAIMTGLTDAATLELHRSAYNSSSDEDNMMVLRPHEIDDDEEPLDPSTLSDVDILDDEADLEKARISNRGRIARLGGGKGDGDRPRSLSVSAMLRKIIPQSSTFEEETIDYETERHLTSNGSSLPLPPGKPYRTKTEKPWASSLTGVGSGKRNNGSGGMLASMMEGVSNSITGGGGGTADDDEVEEPPPPVEQSDHDRVRMEALRMLNLADTRDGSTERRTRPTSPVEMHKKSRSFPGSKLLDRINFSGNGAHKGEPIPNNSNHSEDTEVTNNTNLNRSNIISGPFSIDDGDSDDDGDEYGKRKSRFNFRRKSPSPSAYAPAGEENDDVVVVYDRENEETKEEILESSPSGSNWSSRYSGATTVSSLYSKYLLNDNDTDEEEAPMSARGMMRASPDSSSSSNYHNAVHAAVPPPMAVTSTGRGGDSSKNLYRNAVLAELSKEKKKKLCLIISFVVFLAGCIATIEGIRSSVDTIPGKQVLVGINNNTQDGGYEIDDTKNEVLGSVTFYIMSDVPLSESENGDLASQVTSFPTSADFAVHLGDIHDASKTLCEPSIYSTVSSILSKSSIPLLVLPGDEDYAACPEPFDSLEEWRNDFDEFGNDWTDVVLDSTTNGTKTVNMIERQATRTENFAIMKNEILFIGLNIAGLYARDEREWKTLDEDNIVWTRQQLNKHGDKMQALIIFGHTRPGPRQYDYYFQYFKQDLKIADVPVFYIHGDALEDEPILPTYKPYESDDLNIVALEVQRGGLALPLKVSVTSLQSGRPQFLIDRRKNESS